LHHFGLDDPAAVCVVGDRILTDVVFGNLYGLLTIHTLPLCYGPENAKDNWTAKLLRPMENSVLYGSWVHGALSRRRIPHKFWDGPEASNLLMDKSAFHETPPPPR
jgi:predicted HAD superfamily phosphohydrolase YqeG